MMKIFVGKSFGNGFGIGTSINPSRTINSISSLITNSIHWLFKLIILFYYYMFKYAYLTCKWCLIKSYKLAIFAYKFISDMYRKHNEKKVS